MLSIIIPTLNEEKLLPLLLVSIKDQEIPDDYEIIVADAGSQDKTVSIAESYGCKIIPGGLPAKGRNEGAKVAKGDTLFFADADIILPKHFFTRALGEFKTRNLDLASFGLIPLPNNKLTTFLMDFFYNSLIVGTEKILPHAAIAIFVTKPIFEKVEGFEEDIKLAEDHWFARQAKKAGAQFGIIRSVKVFISDRRFREDGWVSIGIKYFLCELYITFIGPVKSDIFKYRFNHYKK